MRYEAMRGRLLVSGPAEDEWARNGPQLPWIDALMDDVFGSVIVGVSCRIDGRRKDGTLEYVVLLFF